MVWRWGNAWLLLKLIENDLRTSNSTPGCVYAPREWTQAFTPTLVSKQTRAQGVPDSTVHNSQETETAQSLSTNE